MKHRRAYRGTASASRFNLIELLLLTTCVSITCALSARGAVVLGASFLITVIAFRFAMFDFTRLGEVATLMAVVFGTVSIALLVLWSAGL